MRPADGGRVSATAGHCPACGARLAERQRWCLECGAAARTVVAGTPRWAATATVAVLVGIVALAAVGYAVAALVAS